MRQPSFFRLHLVLAGALSAGLLLAAWLPGLAGAAPLDDARKLLADGDFLKVDEVLNKELASQTPAVDVLRVSLEAAEKGGRYITANKRITSLLRATDNQDMEMVFRAAQIADRIGHTRLALSRYLLFAQKQTQASPKLEEAFTYLFINGTFPEEYKKFVDLYGAGPGAWRFGTKALNNLLEDADATGALGVAAAMVKAFGNNGGAMDYVHGVLRSAADNYVLGQSVEDRYARAVRVLAASAPNELGHINHMFNQAAAAIPGPERLQLILALQGACKRPLPYDLLRHVGAAKEIFDLEARLKAGRDVLAMEPFYKDSPDPGDYGTFVRVIVDTPEVFNIFGQVLAPTDQMQARLNVLKEKYDGSAGTLDGYIQGVRARITEDDKQTALLAANIAVLTPDRFSELVTRTAGATIDPQLGQWTPNKPRSAVIGANANLLPIYNQLKRKDALVAAAREYMTAYPGTFNWQHVNAHVAGSELLTIPEKVALLDEIVTKAGATGTVGEILKARAKDWGEDAAFKALDGKFKTNPQGADLVMRTQAAMVRTNKFDEVAGIVEAFLKEFKGELPGGWEQTASAQDVTLMDMVDRFAGMSWNNADQIQRCGAVWLERMKFGSSYQSLAQRIREHGRQASLAAQAPRFIALAKAAGKRSPLFDRIAYEFSQTSQPKDNLVPLFTEIYPLFGAENAARFLYNNRGDWDGPNRQAWMNELEKVTAIPGSTLSRGMVRALADHINAWVAAECKVPVKFTQGAWAALVAEENKTKQYDVVAEALLYGQLAKSGHAEAAGLLQQYFGEVGKRAPEEQASALNALFGYVGLPAEEVGKFAAGQQYHTILNVAKPLFERIPMRDWYQTPIPERVLLGAYSLAMAEPLKGKPEQQQAAALVSRLVGMMTFGASYQGHMPNTFGCLRSRATELLQGKQWDEAARVLNYQARILNVIGNWDAAFNDWVTPLAQAAEDASAFEIAFAYIKTIQDVHETGDTVAKKLSILRAKAAQKMPGFVTVDEGDPSYNLQMAAFNLSLGNEGKAWELTSGQLKVLPKVWETLDQGYVAWAVEQMRKQKLLDPALEMAFTVLLRENELDPEVAAQVLLTKGDIYRDKQNYQAAKIEYEGLKANRRYRAAEAGIRAQYRLIELLILTKDYTTAESFLERLVDSESVRVQAEAYYLYARMMFDQAEYKEANEYLKRVKARVVDHVEAAFLEGELNLRLPGGLQHTEVPVGNPRLSTVAIPGRELTLKLQDSNLAIARANSAIPVVIRTTVGGDEERLKLLPSATDQNLFSGTIATSLGPVQKGNIKLELLGDDKVTYVIDPEFQKANDISYPPKELDVEADGRLVASSGEILTEEEEEKRALESRIREQQRAATERLYRDGRTVRPGSPIYVQVRDFDRDLSDQPDTVHVAVKTGSGDAIERFALKETGPHTGMFRNPVPTGIPLPKATASDTAEGKDPSVLVNSSKTGVWSSLADGKKGKWVEVDTMSSYEVKRIELATPDTAQVRKITLKGLLSEDYETLCTFPERAAANGLGLTAVYFSDNEFKTEVARQVDRFVCFHWQNGAPQPKFDGDMLAVRWTGTILPLYAEEYTFYAYADDGIRLTVGGKPLVDEWRDSGARESLGKVTLEAGKPVEVLFEHYDKGRNGVCFLSWSSPSQAKELVPQAQLFPADGQVAEVRDGVRVDVAYNQNGAEPGQITKYLQVAPAITWFQDNPTYLRTWTPWPYDGWMTARVRGTFHLPENQSVELRFNQDPSPHNWQHAYLFIDEEMVLGGNINKDTVLRSRRIQLAAGAHELKVLLRDHWGKSGITVQYRKDDGTFEDLPASWFSAAEHPELKERLKPAGKITVAEGKISAELDQPRRLRKVRWEFDDFAGNGISASRIGVIGTDGKPIIPVPQDFTTATANNVLEIAPGDRITVAYEDVKRLRPDTPVLSAELNSSYFNGEIMLANEVFRTEPGQADRRWVEYFPAQRCRVGDQLMVHVTEYDADISEERDTVAVQVETSSGEKLVVKALETMPNYDETYQAHAGVFLALLKIGTATGKDTIGVKPGDIITVSYLDSENTKPGIPFARTYSINEGGTSKPEITVYRTGIELIEDKSDEAEARLKRMRVQHPNATILKELVLARHPLYGIEEGQPAPAPDAPVYVDANAPLLFEMNFPKMALNAGSVLTVRAVAQSELDAAKAGNREPKYLEVPMHLYGIEELARVKGYTIRLESHERRDRKAMLQDGIFAGVVRLQIGSPGDTIDDLVVSGEKQFVSTDQRQQDQTGFQYRVATLLVSGSDTLHLELQDESGASLLKQPVYLRSNARLEILDQTYTFQNDAIYLGEAVYAKLTDPDQDKTDERDEVKLTVAATSGDRVTVALSETLAHSGVFTGTFEPQFAGEVVNGQKPAVDANDAAFKVGFGDEVTLAFTDAVTLSDTPLEVAAKLLVRYGCDASVACFSKRFNDPEMAVKTQLLTAEALFEMAKQQRKLAQEQEAAENISAGKLILEESIRDYPNTSFAAQSEFLLANLAEELENYQEAIGRYTQVIRAWPESEYAGKSQFKKALCLEKMENYDQACEEYVKLTYIYPDNPLVADATIRLASYYYKNNAFKVAGKIFASFQARNPAHKLAPKALLLAAHCHMKMEDFGESSTMLQALTEQYLDEKDIRSEAMYWLGDCQYKRGDYIRAYQAFKRLTWDYPESKWAKFARGRLTEESMVQQAEKDGM